MTIRWQNRTGSVAVPPERRSTVARMLLNDAHRGQLDRTLWTCGDTLVIVLEGDAPGTYEVYDCQIRRVADVEMAVGREESAA